MKKLAVLISGNGSNLQAVIDAINSRELDYSIEVVISNKKNAFALQRAENAGIKTCCFSYKKGDDRKIYDANLAKLVKQFSPDYIFLLGWMHILTNSFVKEFNGKILNLHPALPNTFAGTEAIKRQYDAFQNRQISECGIMTHYVTDEGVDSGIVILTQNVTIQFDESLDSFEKRVHAEEHKLVIRTLKKLS